MQDLVHVSRLVLHTLVGVTLFSLIGGATILLHYATGLIEYSGVSPGIVRTIQALELCVFASDAVRLVVFVWCETWRFLREILRSAAGGAMARLFDERMIRWVKAEVMDATVLFFAPVTAIARWTVRLCRHLTGHPVVKAPTPSSWDHRRRSA